MIKTCIVCGKKFDGKNAQKCCSDQCKKIRKKQTDKEKNKIDNVKCSICGKVFAGNKNIKYCSYECKHIGMTKRVKYIRICECCGKKFNSVKKTAKYCSSGCANKKKYIKSYSKTCEKCGKQYKTNCKNQRYCSQNCYKDSIRSKSTLKICINCGKEYIARETERGKFCCMNCYREYVKYNTLDTKIFRDDSSIKRAKNYNRKYEHIDVLKMIERDNSICGICGKPINIKLVYPNRMSFSIDHIIPLSKGGDHLFTNVQSSHLICNIRKNAKV